MCSAVKEKIGTFVSAILLPTATLSQVTTPTAPPSSCSSYQDKIDQVSDKYEAEFGEIEKESKTLTDRANDISKDPVENFTTIDLDITMRDKRIVFDTPSLTMQEKRIILAVPQVSFRLRSISFDVPKVTFALKKTGEYPEVFCEDTWISLPFGGKTKGVPNCTVRWSPIMTKVPETTFETTEVKTKIPEFTWDEVEVIFDVPEFFMERQEWIIQIPEVRLTDVSAERENLDRSAKTLEQRANTVQSQQAAQVKTLTGSMYGCYLTELEEQKEFALTKFDASILEIESSIIEMRELGVDPSAIQSEDGEVDLVALRSSLEDQKRLAIENFNDALLTLQAQQNEAMQSL